MTSDLRATLKSQFVRPHISAAFELQFNWSFIEIRSVKHSVCVTLPETLKFAVYDRPFLSEFLKNPSAFKIQAGNDASQPPLYMWVDRGRDSYGNDDE